MSLPWLLAGCRCPLLNDRPSTLPSTGSPTSCPTWLWQPLLSRRPCPAPGAQCLEDSIATWHLLPLDWGLPLGPLSLLIPCRSTFPPQQ